MWFYIYVLVSQAAFFADHIWKEKYTPYHVWNKAQIINNEQVGSEKVEGDGIYWNISQVHKLSLYGFQHYRVLFA